jgi:hypothetical protein
MAKGAFHSNHEIIPKRPITDETIGEAHRTPKWQSGMPGDRPTSKIPNK